MANPSHWADQTAERIISLNPNKELFTLASGITPSGTVHIGNFREVVTVDLIRRALEKKGKKTRFIFSWDDYDVFRKVPKNMPNQEMLTKYLRKPIIKTPDPFGKFESYAKYHQNELETSLSKVGVFPNYLYQAKKYQNHEYAEGMIKAIKNRKKIASILNKYRQEPLSENWLPVSIFCKNCDSDEVDTNVVDDSDENLFYHCNDCKFEETINIKTTSLAKLLWRIDWPMRWAHEDVDFEPGGKDHSSDGGSYTTAKEISEQIYDKKPPVYMMYDFISIKGKGGKISSSSGDVITLNDVLEVYEPQIVRWLFSSYRANVEFAISFDLDVVKIYEDYDRLERKYFGLEEVVEAKKDQIGWIYELAQLSDDSIPKEIPIQPAFRHLCNILQINNFDETNVIEVYKNDIKSDTDLVKLKNRIKCASNWIQNYAPEEFQFKVNEKAEAFTISPSIREALKELSIFIKNNDKMDELVISEKLYELINNHSLDNKEFFKVLYLILISKEKGPKLAGFICTIGLNKVATLLDYFLS